MRTTLSNTFVLSALTLAAVRCGSDLPPAAVAPAPSASAPLAAPVVRPALIPPPPPKPYPVTEKRPTVDHYASTGTDVRDDYAWLEGATPEVHAWSDAENAYTRKVIDALPGRAGIHERVAAALSGTSADYSELAPRGKVLFALKHQPPLQQPLLVTLSSADDVKSEKVIYDPNAADPTGKQAIDWFVPSRDGKLVAISLSTGGSERGDLHLFDVATGKERPQDLISHVQNGTAGGSVAWKGDGNGFFYTRYPRKGEPHADEDGFFQQIWFHKLGASDKDDVYVLGKDFPRIAETKFESAKLGDGIVASVENGDGGEYDHFYFDGKTWSQFADRKDKVLDAIFAADGSLLLLSAEGAPHKKVLRLDPAALASLSKGAKGARALDHAALVVPESDVVIEHIAAAGTKLVVVDMVGGPSAMRSFDLQVKGGKGKDGKGTSVGVSVDIPKVSSVGEIVSSSGESVLFHNQSFTDPPAWFTYNAKTGVTKKTELVQTSTVSFQDAEVERLECISKDGTHVPMSVLHKKGLALDGSHPTLLEGYGGYGVNRPPRFDPARRVWLDAGGVFVRTNLRGGAELGEEWHEQGKLTKKQNVFDDFAACANTLLGKKYTTSPKLAILGGSNGGLLMGAELVQHPELFGAVVSFVGIYDMLHVERSPNGSFNTTEFGSVNDPDQFKALYAYSPYHHVVNGTKYLPVLMLTGENDPRVEPWHSRKMVARLQEATGGTAPILLRTDKNVGHGIGSPLSAEIDQWTDVYAFLFHALGITETK